MNEQESFQSPATNWDKKVVRALVESNVYRDFTEHFNRTTGLPVALTPVEYWALVAYQSSGKNPFCAQLAQHGQACAACLQAQYKVVKLAAQSARTVECVHGLCETAVPVRKGEHLLGFVRTGQVFRRAPTRAGLARVLKRLARWGVKVDAVRLHAAYFAVPVIARAQYHASVVLLTFLARHLALVSNQVVLQQAVVEDPAIASAKEFIEANYSEKVTLAQVAEAVRMGRFSFCRKFTQATGVHFTRYVSHLRIEKAKKLLHNPHYRISEICYAVGFNSLSQFNRIFNRVMGLSPTAYRAGLGPPRDFGPGQGSGRFKACVAPHSLISGVLRQAVETAEPWNANNNIYRRGVLKQDDWPGSGNSPLVPAGSLLNGRARLLTNRKNKPIG